MYSNLHFNNTKAKLSRSIVDEYYKPLHMKFFKIMFIYSQSKSFALLPSFKLETIVGCVTKQRHSTEVGFSPSLPVVIVKCPVIPYHVGKFLGLMKYIIFSFASEIQG